MKQIVIPDTSIRVSRIAFGTASLHHLFSADKRQDLLHAASIAGITHFDTSPYYGYGLAESDLGMFLRGRRASYTIATKVGLYAFGGADRSAVAVWARKAFGRAIPKWTLPEVDWRIERARASLLASLKRLATDYVDFLFLHEPDPRLMETDEFPRWIESEQTTGRVRAWGVAGLAEKVAPFVQAHHSLAQVVQTRDSLDKRQADFMQACGRDLQLTYGYLSAHRSAMSDDAAMTLMRKALERNRTGAVLVSTRRAERIGQMIKDAGMSDE